MDPRLRNKLAGKELSLIWRKSGTGRVEMALLIDS